MRKIIKAAVALAVGGVFVIGAGGSASAGISGETDLWGQGCPSFSSNFTSAGHYEQSLQYTWIGGAGYRYGDYNVSYYDAVGNLRWTQSETYLC